MQMESEMYFRNNETLSLSPLVFFHCRLERDSMCARDKKKNRNWTHLWFSFDVTNFSVHRAYVTV